MLPAICKQKSVAALVLLLAVSPAIYARQQYPPTLQAKNAVNLWRYACVSNIGNPAGTVAYARRMSLVEIQANTASAPADRKGRVWDASWGIRTPIFLSLLDNGACKVVGHHGDAVTASNMFSNILDDISKSGWSVISSSNAEERKAGATFKRSQHCVANSSGSKWLLLSVTSSSKDAPEQILLLAIPSGHC
jgi:hypothetical protein